MASSGDVVALGLVSDLRRPGGNITGSTNLGRELGPKRLEMLRELMPKIARVAYLVNPDNPAFGPNLQALWTTARSLQLEVQPFEVRGANEFEKVFSEMAKRHFNAFVLQDETSFAVNAKRIADLASKYRLSSVGGKAFAEVGGLIGYGADVRALERRAGYFVDKILRGASPGDLPIEQASTYELVVNRRTAKALGLTIPQSVLVRADRVIE
jgi:putative ABC transport system substrate-binding protein